MHASIEFIRGHPSGSRQLLHGVLLSVVLGIAAAAGAGAAPWWLFVIWLLTYFALALGVELLLARNRATLPQVRSGADYESVARTLDPVDEMIGRSRQVDLLAGTLKTFTERSANIRALYEACRTGAQVRLLLMAPGGHGVHLVAAERCARGSTSHADDLQQEIVSSISRLLVEFSPTALGQVVRLYDGCPHSAVARFGDCYVVTSYAFGRGGSSPTMALWSSQHPSYCQALDRGFQELWEAKSTISLDAGLLEEFGLESQDSR